MADTTNINYTKADFLSPSKMAEKYNLAREATERVMMRLYQGKIAKDGRTPYVIRVNNHAGADKLAAHPLLQDEIAELVRTGGRVK